MSEEVRVKNIRTYSVRIIGREDTFHSEEGRVLVRLRKSGNYHLSLFDARNVIN